MTTTLRQRFLGLSLSSNEGWGGAFSTASASGESVSYNTALKLSAYYACVGLVADIIGTLPKHIMENLPDGTRQRATSHPLYDTLALQPNAMQTSIEFFTMMTAHLEMRNNAYAKLVAGPRGFADQIIPLHPDNVRIESLTNGGYRYVVTEQGRENRYNDEDILHVRGFQLDMVRGLELLPLERESIGVSMATIKYRARFFGNNAAPTGVLKKAGKLSPEAQKNLKESWNDAHQQGNQHSVAILEDGLEWQDIGIDPQKAQLIESEEFNAEDICRWRRVPPSLIGLPSKAASWAGTGIEQQMLAFIITKILPVIRRWEQAISRDLILVPTKYFVKFVLDGLLRGDSTQRYNVYKVGRELGMFTPNDLLRFEDMNPRTDPGGDKYIGDMGRSLSPAQVAGDGAPTPPAGQAEANLFLLDAASRVVNREMLAMKRAHAKLRAGEEWSIEVRKFYLEHVSHVVEVMHVGADEAAAYCASGEAELTRLGPSCMSDWETRRVGELVKVASRIDLAEVELPERERK